MMALIDHIDGPNRDIYLSAATVGVSVHPIDIYKEMRTLRRTNEELQKYELFLTAKGGDAKGGGKYTERYVVELGGTRIVPYNITHALTITGTIITDDGQDGVACFDRSPLSPTVIVDINYVPPQVEVITVSSGTGISAEEHDRIFAIPTAVANAEAVKTELAAELAMLDAPVSGVPAAVRAELAPELAGIIFLLKSVKNKREIKKIAAAWWLLIYDDDGATVILQKELRDFDGAAITDLAAGALAQELASAV